MTVEDIKNSLDEKGIKYTSKMNKTELLDLLDGDDEEGKYIVIRRFKDKEDGKHLYKKGDQYPRTSNKDVPQERINALLSNKNKIGKQLIREQD